jgi:hypothetical protein
MPTRPDKNGRFHDDNGQFVSLRDYIERLIVEHDRAHGWEHQAVKLQATEYERRLEHLNRSFERSAEDRADFLLKDRYDDDTKSRDREARQKAEALESADDALARKLESELKTRDAELNRRLLPLEKFKDRAAILILIGIGLGGVAGSLVTKALGG